MSCISFRYADTRGCIKTNDSERLDTLRKHAHDGPGGGDRTRIERSQTCSDAEFEADPEIRYRTGDTEGTSSWGVTC